MCYYDFYNGKDYKNNISLMRKENIKIIQAKEISNNKWIIVIDNADARRFNKKYNL